MGNQRKEQILQGNAFQDAVEHTHDLNGGYCPGLQALKKNDAARISVDDGSKADGSVDIDNCTKKNILMQPDGTMVLAMAGRHYS